MFKYKAGTRIKFRMEYSNVDTIGTVVDASHPFFKTYANAVSDNQIWCIWDDRPQNSPTFIPISTEHEVLWIPPTYKRNLPDWF